MKKMITLILTAIVVWGILISDLEVSYSYKGIKRTLGWNGLLWCLLDRISIKMYHSDDTPMKPFEYKIEILKTKHND